MEDTVEVRIKDTDEKKTEDEAEVKVQVKVKARINDSHKKQTENAIEVKINDPLETQKKKAIQNRIKDSFKSQIKDPLEEKMNTLQECEGFIEHITSIKFQFPDEKLLDELKGPNRVILSIIHIADKKKENFSYLNMEIFCQCLDNLIESNYVDHEIVASEIENLLRKTFLFAFQDIVSEASFWTHSEEAIKCTKFLLLYLQKHKSHVIEFKEKFTFVRRVFHCIKKIQSIIEEASDFKFGLIFFADWKEFFIETLETIEKYQDYKGINLLVLVSAMLANYLNKFFIEKKFSNDIAQFLSSIHKPIVLELPLKLALKLDEIYMKFLVQAIKEDQVTQDFKDIKKSITNESKDLIEKWEKNYRKTPRKTLPDINELLCLGLYNFVRVSLGNGFKNAFKFYFINNGRQEGFTFSSLIKHIDALPSQVQYFIGEILVRLGKNESNLFHFIIEKNKKKIGFLEIFQEWAIDYVELACSPPYSIILNKFKQDESINLRELLQEITPKIILMDLPEKVYGRFLYNGSIILKLFMDPDGSKGATFVVYLHELAHFLQRSTCETIKASESPKSFKRFEVDEGGYFIENEIFGTCLYYINVEAADYIVSRQVDQDHEQFKKVFNEKNAFNQNKKNISLHRSSNIVLLGQCGSKFRSSSQKPKKKSSDKGK